MFGQSRYTDTQTDGKVKACSSGLVRSERAQAMGEGGGRKNKSTLLVLSFKRDLSREVVYLSLSHFLINLYSAALRLLGQITYSSLYYYK